MSRVESSRVEPSRFVPCVVSWVPCVLSCIGSCGDTHPFPNVSACVERVVVRVQSSTFCDGRAACIRVCWCVFFSFPDGARWTAYNRTCSSVGESRLGLISASTETWSGRRSLASPPLSAVYLSLFTSSKVLRHPVGACLHPSAKHVHQAHRTLCCSSHSRPMIQPAVHQVRRQISAHRFHAIAHADGCDCILPWGGSSFGLKTLFPCRILSSNNHFDGRSAVRSPTPAVGVTTLS